MALFTEVQVSLFVAGAVFGEVQVSLFVAGAVFGEVRVSLFVAGAVFGEIWNDSRSAKCCIFQYKMLVVGVKGNLGCEAGCGLTVSWSDHSRIILGSCSDRPRIGNDVQIPLRFWTVIFRGRRSIWWVWTMTHVAPRIVNNVSFVSRINHEIHFSWQAQYLVKLDNDTCYSAHCK